MFLVGLFARRARARAKPRVHRRHGTQLSIVCTSPPRIAGASVHYEVRVGLLRPGKEARHLFRCRRMG